MGAIVTLLSDFGDADGFVGIMKGVVLSIAPEAAIVDITHAVPPQQILPGALLLRSAVPYFPARSIHLAVVDPGVGSDRQALAIRTEQGILVGPDNGLLSLAAEAGGVVEIVALENPTYVAPKRSQTFHGRDVFAPAVAHLAAGVPLAELGPSRSGFVRLVLPQPHEQADAITGEVIYIDHFGNLLTNISAEKLAGFREQIDSVSIAGVSVNGPMAAYAAVAEGALLAIVNSWDVLEIAVRNGSAAACLGVSIGAPVQVRRRSKHE
ncbi:MAG TPA: SAM-dependent chlorinase/fluorinase [Terriglobales bacterium]|nr:SAM-dependent chlorinase/fluorinase [Terriglobales bacterium]